MKPDVALRIGSAPEEDLKVLHIQRLPCVGVPVGHDDFEDYRNTAPIPAALLPWIRDQWRGPGFAEGRVSTACVCNSPVSPEGFGAPDPCVSGGGIAAEFPASVAGGPRGSRARATCRCRTSRRHRKGASSIAGVTRGLEECRRRYAGGTSDDPGVPPKRGKEIATRIRN